MNLFDFVLQDFLIIFNTDFANAVQEILSSFEAEINNAVTDKAL